ncbi:MAG TPA: hypothetical protein VMB18_00280 [Terriglobales bacterium]|nr:hypothetical protein [Terriglobales bacterium]
MNRARSFRAFAITLATATLVGGSTFTFGQAPKESPQQCVRETVKNENQATNNGMKLMFVDRKETPHGSQTKLMVETTQATAGMLIAVDGKPLTPEQRRAEDARLTALANNPEELKKKAKAEKEDGRRTARMVQAFPDAFIFEYDGTQPGSPGIGKTGDELMRLKFRPNPNYSPPTHTEMVLTGMQGYVLIDINQHRIAKIDGTLFKDVAFGWGILGKLDKGGRFVVEQANVAGNDWEVTRMNLSFTGKELLFKSINLQVHEALTDFRPAPSNLTFAQGVELLRKQSTEVAENRPDKDEVKVDTK